MRTMSEALGQGVPSQSCVGYYRVSTRKQEISGLGLEAQQRAVRDHLDRTNRTLIAELTEIESGKNPDRPKLAEALRLCRLTGSKTHCRETRPAGEKRCVRVSVDGSGRQF